MRHGTLLTYRLSPVAKYHSASASIPCSRTGKCFMQVQNWDISLANLNALKFFYISAKKNSVKIFSTRLSSLHHPF
jgi:hypothetical protein